MAKSRYLSFDDFTNLVEYIPKLPMYQTKNVNAVLTFEQYQLLCKMLFYCALKIDEVLSLTKADIRLKERLITVKSNLVLNQTTIPPIILPELTDHIKNLSENEKLFKITRQTIWKNIGDLGRLSKVKIFQLKQGKIVSGISPILFRQSYKQYMMNQGADEDLTNLKLRLKIDSHSNRTIDDLLRWEKDIYKRHYTEEEIKEFSNEFSKKVMLYKELSEEVDNILKKIIENKKIEIHSITHRTKSIESFENKVRKGISFHPLNMQDLSGIQVICYVKSDVEKVNEIIHKNFIIDPNRSRDKLKELGENIVGYSSKHFVAKFTESRTKLEDFEKFRDIYFEIQVKTILQHTWAEIEHDKMYKNPDLPIILRRRFNLVSGLLEIADNEFQNLHDQEKSIS